MAKRKLPSPSDCSWPKPRWWQLYRWYLHWKYPVPKANNRYIVDLTDEDIGEGVTMERWFDA